MTYQELLKKHIGEKCYVSVNTSECMIQFNPLPGAPHNNVLKEIGENYVTLMIIPSDGKGWNHTFLLENTSFRDSKS